MEVVTRTRVAPSPPLRKEPPIERKDDRIERQELMRLYQRQKEIESQLVAVDLEIERLKEEETKARGQIGRYRERIENTPIREQAMILLTRDYQNTRDSYQMLLKKCEDAQQAENLERRQKGEQFKVIDPARLPEKPFSPNIPKILGLGFLFGMAGGLGMAFFREQLDRSFRDAADLEVAVGLRVLANIPRVKEEPAKKAA